MQAVQRQADVPFTPDVGLKRYVSKTTSNTLTSEKCTSINYVHNNKYQRGGAFKLSTPVDLNVRHWLNAVLIYNTVQHCFNTTSKSLIYVRWHWQTIESVWPDCIILAARWMYWFIFTYLITSLHSPLLYKAKRQHLPYCKVGRCCLLASHGSNDVLWFNIEL